MKVLEYVLMSILKDKHLERKWLLTVFGILPTNTLPVNEYDIGVDDIGNLYTLINEEKVFFTDSIIDKPLTEVNKKINLKSNDLPMIDSDITTTYGILILNSIIIGYPYQGKVKFINGKLEPKMLDNIAIDLLESGKGTVDMHLRYENAVSAIAVLTQTGVPSASRKSITPNPKVADIKAKLLADNKDYLDDPATIAKIQSKLVEVDKEYLKGDSSEGFFISDKSLNVTRMRSMGMYGAEPDFEDESKINVMVPSLSEGWNIDDFPLIVNSIRGGSFARGASTALGGAEVKTTARVFQNYKVDQKDCGVNRGVLVNINIDNFNDFIGRTKLGVSKTIKKDELKGFIGKSIKLRSPSYCITPGTSLCEVCIGERVVNSKIGLNSLATTATSSFLSLFMALVHTSELSVKRYNFTDRIT